MTSTLRDLRTLFQIGSVGSWTDARLLEEFRSRSGPDAEAAFATLVNRHGPMVLRVCRGVLNDEHDAQDTFQATFLVLVRKARSVRKRSSVASWLYGVAHRVASRARVDATRRRAHERRVATMIKESRHDAEVDAIDEAGTAADHDAIDEEIRRLPENYRAAVVLCYLEGLTQEQAAAQLGWPSGTVRGRLCRARDLLRSRLSRRGFLLPAGVAVAGVAPVGAQAAAVPAYLVDATIKSAFHVAGKATAAGAVPATVAALAEVTVRAMSYSRLKPIALLVAGLVTTSGATFSARRLPTTSPPATVVVATTGSALSAPSRPPSPRRDQTTDRDPSALAFPLKGIVIDGDLGDWPRDVKRYPIARPNGQGEDNRDLAEDSDQSEPKATFSVGYDPAGQRIYLAVIVRDAHPVVGNQDPWHTDAVEVFVDGLRTDRNTNGRFSMDWSQTLHPETMPALQYAAVPGPGAAYGDPKGSNPSLVYGDIRKTRTVMAWSRKKNITTYEWAIQAFDRYPERPTRLESGKRIGFDIAVVDQNMTPSLRLRSADPTPSYTCWAPWANTFKGCDASALGDLIFAADPR